MCLKGSLLLLFSCVALSASRSVNITNYDYDHFVYAQQWPQSFCDCSEYRCRIPEKVKTWTVHGLWPTLGKTEKPDYCNRSWPFEEYEILDIENKLEKFWPSLEDSSRDSRISFWQHEWKKHGTCCTDLTYLDSEHKYFIIGLQLNRKYDILSILNDANIVPSRSQTYKLHEIHKAVQGKLGYVPAFLCCKNDSKQRVEEVRICFDKQLNLIDCKTGDEECTNNVPIYYEPLNPYPGNIVHPT
ncbi:ribonuclease Oy-like [Xenia sp. Carnegie-2017]|uniref:ribonuclease Oy-like n=1 Tax=Xenia sp. Carnegie-2017 TaxID=2897299 RepID=UPI001F04A922|nr:ribonuclease Oy-like [Xenia sp. Carnegie-2017]XP_046848756.1 ribonuclease Oy-like [Xenia sp. Carnegie-2017]